MASLASVTTAPETRAGRVRAVIDANPALRAALTPFLAAKLVAFLVPVLVGWGTTDIPNHPGCGASRGWPPSPGSPGTCGGSRGR
jgi:hypothetical protein